MALPIVQGSLVETPMGGVKIDGSAFRQAALAPGKVASAIGMEVGGFFGDVSRDIQQNRNAQQVFKADLAMRKAKDDFTANLATMPDPGTWIPAWQKQVSNQKQAILSDPHNGPAVKRMLGMKFDQWEQATTSEIKIQALRKQVADTTETAKADAAYAAMQGDIEGANNIVKAAKENHADHADMDNFAKKLPGIAAKSQAELLINTDPGNAFDILKKDKRFSDTLGPVQFNTVLGIANEKRNQYHAKKYNETREEMQAAGGIDPAILQQKVKNKEITQRMADGLSNLMMQEANRDDKATYDFARTMVQDHDWGNDDKPEESKRKFIETFPIKNNQYHYALTKSIDEAISKARKADAKEEAPVRKQIFDQLHEDRTQNGYTTPSFEEVTEAGWKQWPFVYVEEKRETKQILGGLSTLRNPKELSDDQIQEFYGKGVTREQVIRAEQDKYNTIQQKLRDWFDDPKNKEADLETATKYLRSLEAPYIMPAAAHSLKQSASKKDELMAWALANPNNPKAKKVLQKLGVNQSDDKPDGN